MRLNLGCGYDLHHGYVNLDLRDIEGVVHCDVSDSIQMSQYRDVGEILAYDILEHFPRAKAREVLGLWISLLAPGGILKIRCPDIRHMMTLNQPDEWIELLLYGGQDYEHNYHKCGFSANTLKTLLESLGMEVTHIEHSTAGNVEIWAVK